MGTAVDRAELLRRISFVGDAEERIKLLVQHGLREDALSELRELMATKTFYFEDQTRCHRVLIGEERKGFEGVGEHDLPILDQVVVMIEDGGALKLRALMAFFGWDEAALGEFLKEVFTSTLKLDPRQNLWSGEKRIMCSWEFSATLKAARHFLPKDSDLRRQVELWVNRAYFMYEFGHVHNGVHRFGQTDFWTGKQFDDFRKPEFRAAAEAERNDNHGGFTYMFDLLAVRLAELGLSSEEMAEDYAVAIERNGRQMQPSFTAGLLASRVVKEFDEGRKERVRIVIRELLPKIFDRYILRGALKQPTINVLLGVFRYGEADAPLQATFRSALIERLADGRFVQAIEGAKSYAQRIDPSYLRRERDVGRGEVEKIDLSALAAEAFDTAFKAKRFGVAALLVIVYGADACFDRHLLARSVPMETSDRDTVIEELCAERRTQIREAFGIAQTVGQTANLDFSFVSASR